jgi:hypothetical protein
MRVMRAEPQLVGKALAACCRRIGFREHLQRPGLALFVRHFEDRPSSAPSNAGALRVGVKDGFVLLELSSVSHKLPVCVSGTNLPQHEGDLLRSRILADQRAAYQPVERGQPVFIVKPMKPGLRRLRALAGGWVKAAPFQELDRVTDIRVVAGVRAQVSPTSNGLRRSTGAI